MDSGRQPHGQSEFGMTVAVTQVIIFPTPGKWSSEFGMTEAVTHGCRARAALAVKPGMTNEDGFRVKPGMTERGRAGGMDAGGNRCGGRRAAPILEIIREAI